jgi:single-stranded-DNA-specific exonuclease
MGVPASSLPATVTVPEVPAEASPGFHCMTRWSPWSHLLTHFGGHTLAAGLEIECEKIDAFITALAEYTAAMDMPFPIQRIDFRLNPAAITPELVKSLSVFEPYGAENSQPVFGLYGLRIDTVQPVSEGKHTKITASKNGTRIRAIMFGANTQQFPYVAGDKVDLAVTLEVNEFRARFRQHSYPEYPSCRFGRRCVAYGIALL